MSHFGARAVFRNSSLMFLDELKINVRLQSTGYGLYLYEHEPYLAPHSKDPGLVRKTCLSVTPPTPVPWRQVSCSAD